MDIREKFSRLKFIEEDHEYFIGKDSFISATTWLSRFYQKFDSDYWSRVKANQRGVNPSVVLAEWEEKRDRAADLGTEVHELIEDRLLDNPVMMSDIRAWDRFKKWEEDWLSNMNMPEEHYPELRVFHEEWKIAGTIDWLVKTPQGYLIYDWKTNKEIRTSGGYSMMFEPFSYLHENELTKYSLQMSLYRLILEEHGINVIGAFLVHIPEIGPIKTIPSIDLQEPLKKCLELL